MKHLVILLFTLVCFSAKAQEKVFPQDFYGIYKGDLIITNPNGEQTIAMELHLNETDSIGKYQYTLVYIVKDERQEREYTLIEVDASKGLYVVDENNGIILDAQLVDNSLYFMFEVQGNLLTTTERFFDDHMIFEITMTNPEQKKVSATKDENPIEVTSYPIIVVQTAKLVKQ